MHVDTFGSELCLGYMSGSSHSHLNVIRIESFCNVWFFHVHIFSNVGSCVLAMLKEQCVFKVDFSLQSTKRYPYFPKPT